MKKKTISAIKTLLSTFVLIGCMALFTGCTSLTYTGSDYNEKNSSLVQTNELFTFSAYTKTSQQENITMGTGISKTPLPDVYAVYVKIKNLSNSADYIFTPKDLVIKAGNETLSAIPPSTYLDAYQRYETGTYAGLQALAPTLGNFANIQNNYQTVNGQTNAASEMSKNANALTGQIGSIAEGITKHSVSLSTARILPNKSEYYYIFLKDPMFLPIDITYKDLTYSFGKVTKKADTKSN